MAFVSLLATGIFWFGSVAIVYYAIVNANYLLVHVLALKELQQRARRSSYDLPYDGLGCPFLPSVAILVPAYNEQETIEENVRSLLTLEYPDSEVIVVNDGSEDATLGRLKEAYDLVERGADVPFEIPCEPIHAVYHSRTHDDLLVIDKANGGKSDALNAGLWLTEKDLFCAVDADTIIDKESLLQVVQPFLEYENVVASGGSIRIVNRCTVEHGQVTKVTLPSKPILGLQVMEYLRAFYSGRLGLDRLNGLIIISGAFGVFKTDVAREVGGYRRGASTEDLEFVIRLHRCMVEADRTYRVTFVPEPVAWTEAPETLSVLKRQRRRWYRGMIETLVVHRDMIGKRKYGRVGTYALPFYVFGETLGPLVEVLGYLLLIPMTLLGVLDVYVAIIFFLMTSVFGVLLSWFGVYSEVSTYRRFQSVTQTVLLLFYGALENFGYRQWKAYVAWWGLYDYVAGVDSWGVMERTGFTDDETATSD